HPPREPARRAPLPRTRQTATAPSSRYLAGGPRALSAYRGRAHRSRGSASSPHNGRHCPAARRPRRRAERDGRATRPPVLAEAVDAEVHTEAPLVDHVHAEDSREGVKGAGAKERRGAAAPAIRRRPRSPDQPKVAAGEI